MGERIEEANVFNMLDATGASFGDNARRDSQSFAIRFEIEQFHHAPQQSVLNASTTDCRFSVSTG